MKFIKIHKITKLSLNLGSSITILLFTKRTNFSSNNQTIETFFIKSFEQQTKKIYFLKVDFPERDVIGKKELNFFFIK